MQNIYIICNFGEWSALFLERDHKTPKSFETYPVAMRYLTDINGDGKYIIRQVPPRLVQVQRHITSHLGLTSQISPAEVMTKIMHHMQAKFILDNLFMAGQDLPDEQARAYFDECLDAIMTGLSPVKGRPIRPFVAND